MLLEMERRDYAQITTQQLSTQHLSIQQLSTQQQTTASPRCVGFHQLNSYESYLASSLAIYDLIAAVAEVGAVDDDQVPNAVLALALATMDQIEDDEVA